MKTKMKKLISNLLAPVIIAGLLTSCQVKGMYTPKAGGPPLPLNVTLMKKSDRDIQAVRGEGYEYYSETIKGDETVIPAAGIGAWKWVSLAKIFASGFDKWNVNDTSVKTIESNNATQIASEKIAADVTKSTFVPEAPAVPVQ